MQNESEGGKREVFTPKAMSFKGIWPFNHKGRDLLRSKRRRLNGEWFNSWMNEVNEVESTINWPTLFLCGADILYYKVCKFPSIIDWKMIQAPQFFGGVLQQCKLVGFFFPFVSVDFEAIKVAPFVERKQLAVWDQYLQPCLWSWITIHGSSVFFVHVFGENWSVFKMFPCVVNVFFLFFSMQSMKKLDRNCNCRSNPDVVFIKPSWICP